MVEVVGFKPTSWLAQNQPALSLSYTPTKSLADGAGFEPAEGGLAPSPRCRAWAPSDHSVTRPENRLS